MTSQPRHTVRIVILGGGFAGAYCARAAERALRGADAEVLLVDRHNYFAFYPLLVEAGSGSLQPRHAMVSVRSFLRRTTFLMAEVRHVDRSERQVIVQVADEPGTRVLPYDHLVLALGAVTRLPEVPGLREYAYEMKTLVQAVALRDRVVELLEQANAAGEPVRMRALLHLVVVGGNFTGVEVAGEFHAFMRQAAARYPRVQPQDCAVTLVERGDRVLSGLDRSLSEWATRHLRDKGVDLRLHESVSEIRADRVVLSGGSTLRAHTVVWCAGVAPNPLIARLGLPVDPLGYVLTERDLRVKGSDDLWAIGDCATNPDAQGNAYPATAQHAIRQGQHLAKALARALRGLPAEPCDIRPRGTLAAVGRFDAVAQIGNVRLTGLPAWLLWRAVYLVKMPGFFRGVRVAVDWLLDLLTPRDFAAFGVHRLVRSARTPAVRDEPPVPEPWGGRRRARDGMRGNGRGPAGGA
jgi:NADH dehydrogenase